ncbi:hypothetical protein BJ508DRAFT_336575 [Ascobolus immersus RN42]|uniref:Uncharacterized protein n=1 Tax=Ascobolus immersus RN42 TaxID=1160509 RepID=A0A3N4HC88_ASCIM|nr:hypothetical protein BJ508DRAFT_336575 [Ascobolus immersus RN42]
MPRRVSMFYQNETSDSIMRKFQKPSWRQSRFIYWDKTKLENHQLRRSSRLNKTKGPQTRRFVGSNPTPPPQTASLLGTEDTYVDITTLVGEGEEHLESDDRTQFGQSMRRCAEWATEQSVYSSIQHPETVIRTRIDVLARESDWAKLVQRDVWESTIKVFRRWIQADTHFGALRDQYVAARLQSLAENTLQYLEDPITRRYEEWKSVCREWHHLLCEKLECQRVLKEFATVLGRHPMPGVHNNPVPKVRKRFRHVKDAVWNCKCPPDVAMRCVGRSEDEDSEFEYGSDVDYFNDVVEVATMDAVIRDEELESAALSNQTSSSSTRRRLRLQKINSDATESLYRDRLRRLEQRKARNEFRISRFWDVEICVAGKCSTIEQNNGGLVCGDGYFTAAPQRSAPKRDKCVKARRALSARYNRRT